MKNLSGIVADQTAIEIID